MKPGLLHLSLIALVTATAFGGERGKMQREVWKEIDGSGTWHLKNDAKFNQGPDVTELIEGISPPENAGDNYGQRLRGYLHAPQSGEYRFYIAGDDNCELWLGESDSKFSAAKISWIVGLG